MPVRLPRWTWLLVLPTLVGALLLMHGLDAHAGEAHPSATAAVAGPIDDHAHADPTLHEHGDHQQQGTHCAECLAGHVMVACVAIITAVGGVRLVRRLLSRGGLAAPVLAVVDRARGLVELARPPDPPWVRLSVMRC